MTNSKNPFRESPNSAIPSFHGTGELRLRRRRGPRVTVQQGVMEAFAIFPDIGPERFSVDTLGEFGLSSRAHHEVVLPTPGSLLDAELTIGKDDFQILVRVVNNSNQSLAVEFVSPSLVLRERIRALIGESSP